jgi:hypothetical protein
MKRPHATIARPPADLRRFAVALRFGLFALIDCASKSNLERS